MRSLIFTLAALRLSVAGALALPLSAILMFPSTVGAHSLDASAVYIFYDHNTQDLLDSRIDGGWTPGVPLLQNGDELGLIIKAVPDNGTTIGVGGYTTFYLPNGVQVVDAAYVLPGNDPSDGINGYDRMPMKGQAQMSNNGVGGDPTVGLGGLVRGPNVAGVTGNLVGAGNVNNGTLPGVYGDLGIFYSTAPETAYGTYKGGTLTNNSGDTSGSRTELGTPLNEWDTWQLAAYGIAGTTNPNYPSSPLLDSNGRGTTGWGLANAVAGPQSGYAWQFSLPDYADCDPKPYAPTTACLDAATSSMGPWQRIKYPGSQIAYDVPGDTTPGRFSGGLDASNVGVDLNATDLPVTTGQNDGSPNAVRWAYGQLTLNSPEFVWVKIRVVDYAGSLDASGCPNFHLDTFGGDAGGEDIGKDHIWRYYDPNSRLWNGCLAIGKPATREIVKVGDTFQYNMRMYNVGATTLSNVAIVDTLPAGTTFVSAVPAQTSGPNPLKWNISSFAPGQAFESVVTVKASGSGILVNSVTATGTPPSGPPIATTAVERTPSGSNIPFLKQSKSVDPAVVTAPGTVRYTITIENLGTGSTGNPVAITENLPAGFNFKSLASATVNGAAVTGAVTVNKTDPNTPVFNVPIGIQPSMELVLVFDASVAAGTPSGSYCNSFVTTQGGKSLGTGSIACVNVGDGTIGDTVFRDWDGDGFQDNGEDGLAGVTLGLYSGACPPSGPVLDTETTNANGFYQFTGLPAGAYCVDAPAAGSGGLPVGYTLTTANDATTVTLASGEIRNNVDFGYTPGGAGSIGDRVFDDVDADGVFGGADAGIPAVTVNLYEDTNGNGRIDAGDVLVATRTTDVSGAYLFSGLATGISYIADVVETDPDIAAYYVATYGNADRVMQTTGDTHAVPSLAGVYTLADFGFYNVVPGSIGDDVFYDLDGNGTRDAGEAGAANVTVNLFEDTDGDGVLDDDEPLVATVITDADGKYEFADLPAGNYIVDIDQNDPDVPNEYAPTLDMVAVTLGYAEVRTDVDFPFVTLLEKSVDLAYDNPAVLPNTLSYSIAPRHPGSMLSSQVIVSDVVPPNTTFVNNAPASPNANGLAVDDSEPADGTIDHVEWDLGGNSTGTEGYKGGVAPAACQFTLPVTANADTWIRQDDVDQQYGAATTIRTTNAATDHVGLLQFPISATTLPVGATLQSVQLRLTPDNGSGTNRQVEVHTLATAFNEGTQDNANCTAGAAWQGPNCTNDWQSAGGNFGTSDYSATNLATLDPTSNDVTLTASNAALDAVVSNWLAGGTNRGLAMVPVGSATNTVDWHVRTDAAAALRPQLVLTYRTNGCASTTVIRDSGAGEVPDSFIQQDSGGNDNSGTATTFRTHFEAGKNNHGLVRFNLSSMPTSALINSATMQLTVTGRQASSAVEVHRMLTDWTEGSSATNGVQWNDPNGTGTAGTWAGGVFGSSDYDVTSHASLLPTTNGPKTASVTNLVQGWYDGSYNNYGLVLLATAKASDVSWASSENGTPEARPTLSVNWTLAPNGFTGTSSISTGWTVAQNGDSFPVRMTLTNSAATAVTGVVPSALSVSGIGGANATCGSAFPASATVPAGGQAEFTWTCTITAVGTSAGSVTFGASASSATATWSAATSNSVIASPVLKFQVNVTNTPGVGQIDNTASIFDGTSSASSNTVHTALTSTIGDFVWIDVDADGLQDVGEIGMGGVRVFLDADGDGQYDAGETFTTTDASGGYLFTGIANGSYTVALDTTTLPADYIPTTDVSLSRTITANGQQVTDADFGVTSLTDGGSIGDTVWIDRDEDGVVDATEPPIAGATVELWRDANNNGVVDSADFLVGTAVTDENGNYLFDDLYPADYLVVLDLSAPVTTEFGVTTTIAEAMELVSGTNPRHVTLTAGEDVADADFGLNWGGSIGDHAWYDKDADGVQDGPIANCNDSDPVQECPAPGMTAALYYDVNGDGSLDSMDKLLGAIVTDANGFYLFDNLPPGNYIVKGSEQEVPAPASSANAGQTSTMVHTAGSKRVIELAPNEVDLTADFGLVEAAEIEGHVFHDADRNGRFDATETPLAGITVTLTGTDSFGNPVSMTTVTDADGEYGFLVPTGDYTITYDGTSPAMPANLTDTTTPVSLTISPVAGQEIGDLDFGRDDNGRIGDFIWNDADGDGTQDAGEQGLAGVTVMLWLDPNGDGNLADATLVSAQATDASGNYVFAGLPNNAGAERYVVEVVTATLPAGFSPTGDPNEAGTCVTCDGKSVVRVVGGASILTQDFGYRSSATADMSIDKTGPGGATPGTTIVYTLVVTNNGTSNADSVVVTDPTPAGLTFVSNSGACATAFPCALGTVASGTSRTITATYSVPASYTAPNPIVNTATVSSATPDPVPANNSDSATTGITFLNADLAVVKSGPATAVPGSNVIFTVVVTNNGPASATNAVVTDPTPGGLVFVSNAGDCATTYPCSLGTIASGATRTITSTYQVPATYTSPGTIVNTAVVSSDTTDSVPTNDSDSHSVVVDSQVDLSVVKSDPGTGVMAGNTFTYTVRVTNNGPATATNVVAVDTLDSDTTYVADTGGCVVAPARTLTCALGTLAPAASTTFAITVSVSTTAPSASEKESGGCNGNEDLCNTVTVSSAEKDLVPENNTDVEPTDVFGIDLVVLKTDSGKGVNRLEDFAYTITVRNDGWIPATDVVAVDTLDPYTTYVADDGGCVEAPAGVLSCPIGTLAPGTEATVHVIVRVAANAPTVGARESGICNTHNDLCNRVTVSAAEADADPENNTDDEPTDVIASAASADLSITKTDMTGTVQAGSFSTYRIVVGNAGPGTATDVKVVDILDPSMEYVLSTLPCVEEPIGMLTCALGDVANGATVELEITVRVAASAPTGSVEAGPACSGSEDMCNRASVSSPANDIDPTDNAAEVATDVAPATVVTDLSLAKSDVAAEPVQPGGAITYRLVVTNSGPNAADHVVVHEALDADTTYVSDTAGCSVIANATVGNTSLSCLLGTIAAGESVSFDVVVTVNADARVDSTVKDGDCGDVEDICNEALVTASSAELVVTNNDDSEPTDVSAVPTCSNGIVDGNEQCDLAGGEVCNNGVDDDGDFATDCADPECDTTVDGCNGNCETTPACLPILNDPARISENRVQIHGRMVPPVRLDPRRDGVKFVLTNENGNIYEAELFPGDMKKSTGKNVSKWAFKDKTAKKTRGIRDGIFRLGIHERFEKNGELSYVFTIRAYGDMTKAELSTMTTQIYIGDYVAYLTADWLGNPGMWELTRKAAGQ